MPFDLAQTDSTARFLYSKSKFSPTKSLVKPSAFDPPVNGDLSVAHTTSLDEDEIWALGRLTLTPEPGRRTVLARGDIGVACYLRENLKAVRDDLAFRGHVSVIGWPILKDPDEQKQLRKDIAARLSQNATLTTLTTPITLE